MKKLIVFAISFLVVFGCAATQTTNTTTTVCDQIPDGSYSVLCEISSATGISLENVAGVLQTGNLAGLAADAYTADQAMDFVCEIRTYLTRAQNGYGILYTTLLGYLEEKYGLLPGVVQASITLASQIAGADLSGIAGAAKMLSDYDFELLYRHLDAQEEIIKTFLTDAQET
jgi:hypothetical protein